MTDQRELRATSPTNVDLAHERTGMAKLRTHLALDRTTLAWIRTTLTMATFGFGIAAFFRTMMEQSPTPLVIHVHKMAIRFGVALIVLSVLATVAAAISHWSALRRLRRDEAPVLSQWPISVAVAMLLALIGLVSLWSLLADAPAGNP